jgi:hypothetical protein
MAIPLNTPSLRASRETDRTTDCPDRAAATATGRLRRSDREIRATAMRRAGMWIWMMWRLIEFVGFIGFVAFVGLLA